MSGFKKEWCIAVGGIAGLAAAAWAQSFDDRFLATMRSHHQMGLAMARIAETRVQHGELKKKIGKMIDGHQKDLAQIAELLGNHRSGASLSMESRALGSPVAASQDRMTANVMGLQVEGKTEMEKLRTGEPPDKHFLKSMIPHHAGAVLMSHEAVMRAGSPDVRAFARKLLDAQAKEIGELRDMHARWYGKL